MQGRVATCPYGLEALTSCTEGLTKRAFSFYSHKFLELPEGLTLGEST